VSQRAHSVHHAQMHARCEEAGLVLKALALYSGLALRRDRHAEGGSEGGTDGWGSRQAHTGNDGTKTSPTHHSDTRPDRGRRDREAWKRKDGIEEKGGRGGGGWYWRDGTWMQWDSAWRRLHPYKPRSAVYVLQSRVTRALDQGRANTPDAVSLHRAVGTPKSRSLEEGGGGEESSR
jgi:hypothetical protein